MVNRDVALYEVPKMLERARVLDDSVLSAYNESVTSKYDLKAQETLKKFSSANGELAGSNIPMLIHLQEYGLLGGARLATRSDIEKALSFGLDLFGNYVDFGVALRGENVSYAPNRTSATNLVSQLKQRGIKLGNGKLIPLSVLTQREDASSGYGLTLCLKDDVSMDSIQELADFKWDYTTKEGIARAYLSVGGYWFSNFGGLANSDDFGRVVVVSAEGTSQNFLRDLRAKESSARANLISCLRETQAYTAAELKRLKRK